MLISRLTGTLTRCLCTAAASALLLTACSDDDYAYTSANLPSANFTSASKHDVTVQWLPPTVNEDGSPLTDLAGFKILHGTRSNIDTRVIDIPNPAATSFTIEDLPDGIHFFTITAYNRTATDGIASQQLAIKLP